MDLGEHLLEHGDRCVECGAKLTTSELRQVIENGGPNLCAIHAAEVLPATGEDGAEESA